MWINLNWLKDYVAWDQQASVDELLDLIARRLAEIETVVNLADKYAGIEVVRVTEVEVFPDHDRIRLATLETAHGSQLVVCGASNLSPGQLALWLPVGGTVPATWGSAQPVVLEPKEIAGVISQGMLLSAAELDWGTDSDGIIILDDSDRAPFWAGDGSFATPTVGQSLVDYLDLGLVIEIDNKMFTHRPDCFGLLGLAREVAGITSQPLQPPDWYRLQAVPNSLTAPQVSLDCPNQASRLRITRLMELTVKPSAVEVLARLSSVGIKPVNNLVDVTNYLMYLSGQPTHAFDWSGLGQPTDFSIRRSRANEKLELIGDQTITLTEEQPATLVVADDQPVALGGIMGGQATAINDRTTEVLLECANFDMYDIWRTTMNYGLFTPAATCFSKGQSPHQIDPVSRRTAELLALVGEGTIVGDYDCWPQPVDLPPPIKIRPDFINERLGSKLNTKQIQAILAGVELESRLDSATRLEVKVPFWRTDLTIVEDLVEEVGRLGGYETIPPVLPRRSVKAAPANRQLLFGWQLREILAGAGANEVTGYSFVGSDLLKAAGQSVDQSFTLKNALRPDLQFYRQSLTPTLIDLMRQNRHSGQAPLALFELDCCHWRAGPTDDEGLPLGQPRLGLVYLGSKSLTDRPLYGVRRYLDLIGCRLGVEFDYQSVQAQDLPANWLSPYRPEARATIRLDQQAIGVVGDLGGQLAGFELDPVSLDRLGSATAHPYQPLGRYPSSYQDLTLKVAVDTPYAALLASLQQTLEQTKFQWQLELLSIWAPPDQRAIKHVSWRLVLTDPGQTLATTTVSAVVEQLVAGADRDHQASLVT